MIVIKDHSRRIKYSSMNLDEATRREIINLSKSDTRGRFDGRMSVSDSNLNINRVGMLELTAMSPHLDIYFEIHTYRSSIRLEDFTDYLKKNYRQGNYDLDEYADVKKLVDATLKEAIDRADLQVDCTCPDFRYRFAYVATKGRFKLGKPENRPARKTNPNNEGSVCKHLARVMNIPSKWINKVATAVVRSIRHNKTIVTGL